MTVGVTYTFRLTVTDVQDNAAYGEVRVTINAPPSSGTARSRRSRGGRSCERLHARAASTGSTTTCRSATSSARSRAARRAARRSRTRSRTRASRRCCRRATRRTTTRCSAGPTSSTTTGEHAARAPRCACCRTAGTSTPPRPTTAPRPATTTRASGGGRAPRPTPPPRTTPPRGRRRRLRAPRPARGRRLAVAMTNGQLYGLINISARARRGGGRLALVRWLHAGGERRRRGHQRARRERRRRRRGRRRARRDLENLSRLRVR